MKRTVFLTFLITLALAAFGQQKAHKLPDGTEALYFRSSGELNEQRDKIYAALDKRYERVDPEKAPIIAAKYNSFDTSLLKSTDAVLLLIQEKDYFIIRSLAYNRIASANTAGVWKK